MYRPLPKEVTIKKSYIEGLGLFANDNLSANTELGISKKRPSTFDQSGPGFLKEPTSRKAFISMS